MANKLKKSKTKPKSQRAIEEEKIRQARVEAYEAEAARVGKAKSRNTGLVMCYWSLAVTILSLFYGLWGILAIVAIVLGILGIRRVKEYKKAEYYVAVVSVAISSVWLVAQIVLTIMSYLANQA